MNRTKIKAADLTTGMRLASTFYLNEWVRVIRVGTTSAGSHVIVDTDNGTAYYRQHAVVEIYS